MNGIDSQIVRQNPRLAFGFYFQVEHNNNISTFQEYRCSVDMAYLTSITKYWDTLEERIVGIPGKVGEKSLSELDPASGKVG